MANPFIRPSTLKAASTAANARYFRLYFCVISQPARSVKALLAQAGGVFPPFPNAGNAPLIVDEVNVEIHDLEHKSKDYKKVSRDGVIPHLIEYSSFDDFQENKNGFALTESASVLKYLSRSIPSLNIYYGLAPGQDPTFRIKHQIDALLDFCGTTYRPAYMGVFNPMNTKYLLKQDGYTSAQKVSMETAISRNIPIAYTKLERKMIENNPDGEFATALKCPETGKNIPSIADIQLFIEFQNYLHFKDGELNEGIFDHFNEKFPRIKQWHQALLGTDDLYDLSKIAAPGTPGLEHSEGLRLIQSQWAPYLDGINENLYWEKQN